VAAGGGVLGVHGAVQRLHQPLPLSVIAWGFWAVAALLEAVVIVAVLERGARAASPGSARAQQLRPSP
jgi:hypothetical protein